MAIDVIKMMGFFSPVDVKAVVNVVGCGAIGSHVADTLAHLGIEQINLFDFDVVEGKNIANQNFGDADIGKTKVDALSERLHAINPDINITCFPKGYVNQSLSGYVFLCVDSMEVRNKIVDNHIRRASVNAMFDFRMGLKEAQFYAAKWADKSAKTTFKESMNFSDEQAKEDMPISACGTTLSVIPTIRAVVAFGMANFINIVKGVEYCPALVVNPFESAASDIYGMKK